MDRKKIKLNIDNIKPFIDQKSLDALTPEIIAADEKIKKGTGKGANFLGWLHLPSRTDKKLISDINNIAGEVRKNKSILLCIGIGGSYLGSRAGIEFLSPLFSNKRGIGGEGVFFCGNNLNSDYIEDLLGSLEKDADIYVNVISKSGTTIEPALAFRLVYDYMRKRYDKKELTKRVICTTDKEKGALKKMASQQGFRTFVIPDDVGGRFSVLTPVGLFPMACAGVNIEELLNGAADLEQDVSKEKIETIDAYKYAAVRNALYRQGKHIEILSDFHPSLHSVLEWCKQLLAESEGKEGKGIFPSIADFTTDLHAIGQLIQQGARNIFETFVIMQASGKKAQIPQLEEDIDQLNYLAGKTLDYVDSMAYRGTVQAHTTGGVPNMTLQIPERSAYCLGQIYYFFEISVAVSGYLLGINPFDQPGVEAYKNNMYKLLNKPR